MVQIYCIAQQQVFLYAKAECKGYCEDSIKILTAKIEELEDDILNLAPENSNTNMQDSSL